MNAWNLIGLLAWAILIAYFIFIVWHIRRRHIKAIVKSGRQVSVSVVLIDLAEVVVLFLATAGLVWASWLRPINYRDSHAVTISHSAQPLILQTGDEHSYYVRVHTGNGKNPILYYTYWTEGAKYENNSHNAEVSSGAQPLTPRAAAYPWSKKYLKRLDQTADRAYVATVTARYQPGFLNGLGMHVGHIADRFSILRVPNETFVEIDPVED
ncbi:hypothetical protein BVJ53_06920 [Lacticaseibacillus chiayiensis]|uniref:Uncharacterized protein n=1 Tax=Lacticaseibacillus chiayiensis TaxID=2100821 RepID=A0A4Q1U1D3_9LACO|nr:LVIS_2131 family protein [Lacticaseibacillus chiayiensis]QVI34918.1 hypothetical protein KG086_00790 [Lacticaseibacillus chiayiensis]RXT24973.1 hypothetical protein BVJ53_06920 [Lacticaseibacillus chiayiensis]RXT58920.1 hypothetical protein CHT97_03590 [Lacticaseibacillus chiayiensis]